MARWTRLALALLTILGLASPGSAECAWPERCGGEIAYASGNVLTESGYRYLTSPGYRIPLEGRGPVLYVSQSNGGNWPIGNDSADGMTAGTAIATCGEMRTRVAVEENYFTTVILDSEGLTDCTSSDLDFAYPSRSGEPRSVGLKISCFDWPRSRCPITYGATNPTIAFAHLGGAGGGFDIAPFWIITEGIDYTCGSSGSDRNVMIADDGLFGIHHGFRSVAGCGTPGQNLFRSAQKSRHLLINAEIITAGNQIALVTEAGAISFLGSGQPLYVNNPSDSNSDAFVITADYDGIAGHDGSCAGITVIGHQITMDEATHASASVINLGPNTGETSALACGRFIAAANVIVGSTDTDAGGPIVASAFIFDVSLLDGNPFELLLYQNVIRGATNILSYIDGSGAGANARNRQVWSHNYLAPDNAANGQVLAESSHINGLNVYDVGSYYAKGNVVEEYGDTESSFFEINGVSNASMAALDADRAGSLASAAIGDFFRATENSAIDNVDQHAGSCSATNFWACTCDITGIPAACGTLANRRGQYDLVPLAAPIPKELVPGATQDLEYVQLYVRQIGPR